MMTSVCLVIVLLRTTESSIVKREDSLGGQDGFVEGRNRNPFLRGFNGQEGLVTFKDSRGTEKQSPYGLTPSSLSFPNAAQGSPSLSTSIPSQFPQTSSSDLDIGSLRSLAAIIGGVAGGSGNPLAGLVGVVEPASGAVRSVLEIKRDIIPAIMGFLNAIRGLASSEILRSISDIKIGAARTALSVGPGFISTLAGMANVAGEVTGSLIKLVLCSIICPLQSDISACQTRASCDGPGRANSFLPSAASSSSAPSSSYIVK